MDNEICLFLGAGASKAFGYPTTVEFLSELQDVLPNYEFFKQVVEFLEKDQNEQADIEKVIWELENLVEYLEEGSDKKRFKKKYFLDSGRFAMINHDNSINSGLKAEYARLLSVIGNINEGIKKQVYHIYWREPAGEDTNYKEVYSKLFDTLQADKINIFTTNYDTSLDNLFLDKVSKFRDEFADGFDNDIDGSWFTNNYDKSKKYKIYKLHGSVNWKKSKTKKTGIYRLPESNFTTIEDNPLLYPGSKSTKEYPFNELYGWLFNKLTKTNTFIFIGFSFRDDDLNGYFKDGHRRNNELNFIIWNPDDVKPWKPEDDDHEFDKKRVLHFPEKFELKTIDKFLNFITNGKLMKMRKLAAATAVPGSDKINKIK